MVHHDASRPFGATRAEAGDSKGQLGVSRRDAPLKGAVRALIVGVALAGSAVFGNSASAGARDGFIEATRSVSAPQGARGLCARYAWSCAARSAMARPMDDAELLAMVTRVNSSVNTKVRQISDMRQYRTEELWALPTKQGGDCEDFALLKKHELIRLGVPPHKLLLATALTRKRESHAVLIVRTGRGDMVLDNLTSRVRPWNETGYSFLRMQNPDAPASWRLVMAGGMFATGKTPNN